MTHKFKTKDFALIQELVRQNKVQSIGIDYIASVINWNWVFYYNYQA